jgi:Protein of unknown function (DUF1761)
MATAILSSVNYLAVIVAAAAAWIFGAIYYGALGGRWIAAQGKTMASLKQENAGKSKLAKASPFILSFVGELIMAFVLFGILTHMGKFTLRAGIISAAFCWFGFVLTTVTINNAYSGRRVILTVIDALHWLGALLIIGAIVGWFGP